MLFRVGSHLPTSQRFKSGVRARKNGQAARTGHPRPTAAQRFPFLVRSAQCSSLAPAPPAPTATYFPVALSVKSPTIDPRQTRLLHRDVSLHILILLVFHLNACLAIPFLIADSLPTAV